ncbi:hypothetical protein [Streptococcus gallolyticus]|uniref:hypothetical protein n=1 Tax=Streptococcus gallolyticus TaxID=315405 RepID=UPI002285089F|nr:hypothetical protein [Streptococcus gallolyticus]MCY7193426.1 hypothetical protein [Streptococcus gallolyticus subsp. gallolyticus]
MKKVFFRVTMIFFSFLLLTACSKSNLGEEQRISSGGTMTVKSIEKYSDGEVIVSAEASKDTAILAEYFDVVDDSKTHLKFKEFQEGENTFLNTDELLMVLDSQDTGDFKVVFDLADSKTEKFTVSYDEAIWNN